MKNFILIALLSINCSVPNCASMDWFACWLPCRDTCTSSCCAEKEKSNLRCLQRDFLPELTNLYGRSPEDLKAAVTSARSARGDDKIAVTTRSQRCSDELIDKIKDANKESYQFKRKKIQQARLKECAVAVSLIFTSLASGGQQLHSVITNDESSEDKAGAGIATGFACLVGLFTGCKMLWHAYKSEELQELNYNRDVNSANAEINARLLKNQDTLIGAITDQQVAAALPNRPIHAVAVPRAVALSGYVGRPASGSHILRADPSVVPVLSFAHDDSDSLQRPRSTPPVLECEPTSSEEVKRVLSQQPPPPTNRTLPRTNSEPDLRALSHRDTARTALAAATKALAANKQPAATSQVSTSQKRSDLRISVIIDGKQREGFLTFLADQSSSPTLLSAAAAAAAGQTTARSSHGTSSPDLEAVEGGTASSAASSSMSAAAAAAAGSLDE